MLKGMNSLFYKLLYYQLYKYIVSKILFLRFMHTKIFRGLPYGKVGGRKTANCIIIVSKLFNTFLGGGGR